MRSPKKFDSVHQTVSLREREGSGTRLQATMHYYYIYVYIDMCIYAKSPKVTITFIHRSKIVVQETYGLIHISDFESIKCRKVQSNPNLLYSI